LARTLPRDYVLVLGVLFYLFIEALARLAAGNWRNFLLPPMNADVQDIFKVRDSVLIMAATCYGIWRVAAFHPFYRPAYAEWLKQTPWTSRNPLPAGPIHLVIQDLVVAAVFVAAMHSSALPRQWIPVAILVGHSMAAGLAVFWTGPRAIAYTIGTLLGLLVLVLKDLKMALVVAISTSLVAHGGIRASRDRFPWEMPEAVARFFLGLIGRKAEMPKRVIGYPYDGLSPQPPEPTLPLADGIALSLLPAWWNFAANANLSNDDDVAGLGTLCMYVLLGLIARRSVVYLINCRPPISLWGRIMTGRWIIPGYDRALLAPLVAPIVGIGLLAFGIRSEVPLKFVVPACIAAVLLVTLNMGPSLRTWRLTGAYRLVPTKDRKNLIEL
jgi:hypothetical protein